MDSLLARLQRVEDQMAIYQVISAYGPSADSCDMDALAKACAADACYELADIGAARGWEEVRALFDTPFHQDLVRGGSAHIASLPHIHIDGDRGGDPLHAVDSALRRRVYLCAPERAPLGTSSPFH